MIQESGILLRLPQVVMVLAQMIFHQFYFRQSLVSHDVFLLSISCLFLAAKLEEKPKALRDVLNVYYAVHSRRRTLRGGPKNNLNTPRNVVLALAVGPEEIRRWKDLVLASEKNILISLGFRLYHVMDQVPHKLILYFCKILNGSNVTAQNAWNVLNDGLRLSLTCRFTPEAIACAALDRSSGQEFPNDWWTIFNTSRETLDDINAEIEDMYSWAKEHQPTWVSSLGPDPFNFQFSVPEHLGDHPVKPVETLPVKQERQDQVKQVRRDRVAVKQERQDPVKQERRDRDHSRRSRSRHRSQERGSERGLKKRHHHHDHRHHRSRSRSPRHIKRYRR